MPILDVVEQVPATPGNADSRHVCMPREYFVESGWALLWLSELNLKTLMKQVFSPVCNHCWAQRALAGLLWLQLFFFFMWLKNHNGILKKNLLFPNIKKNFQIQCVPADRLIWITTRSKWITALTTLSPGIKISIKVVNLKDFVLYVISLWKFKENYFNKKTWRIFAVNCCMLLTRYIRGGMK